MSDAILAQSWPEVWHRARQHEATHYSCSHGKVQSRPVHDDPNQIDTPTTLTANDPLPIRSCREKKEDCLRWTWSASAPNGRNVTSESLLVTPQLHQAAQFRLIFLGAEVA